MLICAKLARNQIKSIGDTTLILKDNSLNKKSLFQNGSHNQHDGTGNN
ncbi:MAG: hypothetical protein ACI9XO_000937 [Paraglaciecola sp.]|jgi:hypothetical protein